MRQRWRAGNASVSSAIDTGRLAEALSRPGIDPRMWASVGVVTDVFVDPEHGPMVDVTLLPSGQDVTARQGAAYAGVGFGFYTPIAIEDEVLVVLSNGELGESPVVVSRLWSASDTPPTEAVDAPLDLLLSVEKERNITIKVVGGGNVTIDAADGGNVLLKVADGKVQLVSATGERIPMGETLQSLLSDVLDAIASHTHVCAVGPTAPPTNAPSFLLLKAHPVADGAMLSDHATVAK